MKLRDLRRSVREALKELPYPQYLCAMLVICRQFERMYCDLQRTSSYDLAPGRVQGLMRATLSIVDRRIRQATFSAGNVEADGLVREWEEAIEEIYAQSSPALLKTCTFFHTLVSELAGTVPQYAAIQFVTRPVVDFGVSLDPRGFRVLNTGEEADESSFSVRILRRFQDLIAQCQHSAATGQPIEPNELDFSVFD
jgi:hypothetical protein